MFDVIVKGIALGWEEDGSFPALVKVALTDVDGGVHHIIEKEPVLVAIPLAIDTKFPIRLGVRGTCIRADSGRSKCGSHTTSSPLMTSQR